MPSARAKKRRRSVLYISTYAAAAAISEHHGTFTSPHHSTPHPTSSKVSSQLFMGRYLF